MSEFGITFGAMADPIKTQLSEQLRTAPPKELSRWQKCADAITLLLIHGYMNDAQGRHARQRLMNKIAKLSTSARPAPKEESK